MAFKDIEKLKEKIAKDPNSKLFVPLAEEYRKEGMVEEAIEVLRAGLEKQPGYMSARVALGKIYLEKGLQKEAREEFENVIKMIPDNLYSQKKLAEIYRDSGETDLAIKAYRTVLKLNSMDEDAGNSLRELESSIEEAVPEESFTMEPTAHAEEVPVAEAIPEDSHDAEDFSMGGNVSEEVEPIQINEDFDAFKESLFGVKDEAATVHEEGNVSGSHETWPEHGVSDDAYEIQEIDKGGKIDFSSIPAEAEVGDAAEVTPAEAPVEAEEAFETEIAPVVPGNEEGIPGYANPPEQGLELTEGTAEADRLISEGNYAGAMRTYKKVLLTCPGDRQILQRLEELRSLLKLMGKDKETLILNLTAFLDGIKKRQNGFSASP